VGAAEALTLPSAELRALASGAGFDLCGFARADPIPADHLVSWLEAGMDADMDWMRERVAERLDVHRLLPGARTVVSFACNYFHPDPPEAQGPPPVARYARGRDYHYAHRDRMKRLRERLLQLDPAIETYACVDTGLAMEKAWAERAGLGFIGKNGLLINRELGSWLTLSVMFLDREVDAYDHPQPNLCGDCTRCLGACPTQAFPAPGVVDSRRCVAYLSIEHQGSVPEPLRRGFAGRVFGCEVCQEVCPFNRADLPVGDARFAPRPLSALSAAELAGLSEEEFQRLAAGTAVARARYDGLRRNALLSLGAARDRAARALVEKLCADPSALVAEAARWALDRIDGRPRRANPAANGVGSE